MQKIQISPPLDVISAEHREALENWKGVSQILQYNTQPLQYQKMHTAQNRLRIILLIIQDKDPNAIFL